VFPRGTAGVQPPGLARAAATPDGTRRLLKRIGYAQVKDSLAAKGNVCRVNQRFRHIADNALVHSCAGATVEETACSGRPDSAVPVAGSA
jgi:hypothetical protein